MTPPSLAQQWVDELALHAPTLNVLVYPGWVKIASPLAAWVRKRNKRARNSTDMDIDMDARDDYSRVDEATRLRDWCDYVNEFDVCVTTYAVLQHDLGVARPPPNRPRRTIATYIEIERARSPLVACEWYRVIMDEVQMVGGGKTE